MKTNLALFAIGLASTVCFAQVPAFEVKGIQIGGTVDNIRTQLKLETLPQRCIGTTCFDSFGFKCLVDTCRVIPEIIVKDRCRNEVVQYGVRSDRPDPACQKETRDSLRFGSAFPRAYSFSMYEGKIESMTVTFLEDMNSRRNFDNLVPALIEKYGKPTSDDIVVVQNAMGAKFDNRVLRWIRPDANMTLSKYGSELTNSYFAIVSSEHAKHESSKALDAAKASAKNL